MCEWLVEREITPELAGRAAADLFDRSIALWEEGIKRRRAVLEMAGKLEENGWEKAARNPQYCPWRYAPVRMEAKGTERAAGKETGFVTPEEGRIIRAERHVLAKRNYQPRHPEEYISFMNNNECSFSINHPQSVNHPLYFRLFTVKSQSVHGDCVEECLDKAIEA